MITEKKKEFGINKIICVILCCSTYFFSINGFGATDPTPATSAEVPSIPKGSISAPGNATNSCLQSSSEGGLFSFFRRPNQQCLVNKESKQVEPAKDTSESTANKKTTETATEQKPTQAVSNTKRGPPANIQPTTGYLEAGGQYFHLTDGYNNWNGEYVKGFFQINDNNNILLEADHDQRFGQIGDYVVGEYTHIYNDDWYSNLGAGISDRSTFIPRNYVGGAIFRKFGSKKQWIPYLGVHAYWWRPIPLSTQDVNPGLIYYFQSPWVAEGGMFFNRSNPGVVNTKSYYVAVTQGKEKEHFLTLRYGFGREGYQGLLVNSPTVNYPSHVITLTWRQWVGKNWGFNLIAEDYKNPFYQRYGGTLGIFGTFG